MMIVKKGVINDNSNAVDTAQLLIALHVYIQDDSRDFIDRYLIIYFKMYTYVYIYTHMYTS